jgi:diadenylate cyclase
MESLILAATSAWRSLSAEQLWDMLGNFRWSYLIDIGIMTFIIYQAYLRFRGTRAIRILEGVAILGLGGLAAQKAGLFLTSWLLSGIGAAAVVFFIVIFQAEIRQMLERVNPRLPASLFRQLPQEGLAPLSGTIFALAAKRCGALFVFERRDFLEPLFRSPGVILDAQVSPELIENLFTPPTPLHDGALYLREGRIYRAGCVLPLSENSRLASFYGTRHRAALGISEQSDALAVVISEERGGVSVAEKGTLEVVKTPAALLTWLTDRLSAPTEKSRKQWLNLELITQNWRPKLASLMIVGILWFVLVGRQDTEVGFSVPVLYTNVPKTLSIQDQGVQEVYVRVRGSEEMLNFLDLTRLRVAIDLRDAKAGSQRYPLAAKDINLPPGLQLIGIDPAEIRLRLRETPVEPNGGQQR